VQVLTTRAALGGPWAANGAGTLLLFPPSIVLVVLQESTTPFPSVFALIASALAQFTAGFAPVLIAMIVRRSRSTPIPLSASFSIWVSTAVIRGVVGGVIAETVAGVPPEYALRIAFWLTLAVFWMPVFVYTLAHWEQRRALLGELDAEVIRLSAEIERGEHATGALRDQLVATVRDAVSPVIDEIRRSLAAVAHDLDQNSIRSIGGRIAIVAADAARIVDNAGHPRRHHVAESPHVTKTRAVFFSVRSPLPTALLTGLLLAPLAIPIGFRASGALGWEVAVALVVVMASLALAFGARRLRPERSHGRGVAYVFVASFLAGFTGSIAIVALPWAALDPTALVLAAVLPLGVGMCGATIGSVLGVAEANRELSERITLVRADIDGRARDSDAEERRVREQLAAVLHGPVQGRLSACVMALNFHEASGDAVTAARTTFITSAVLDHLEAAAADLDALAENLR
jgi:hypothetical protein